MNFGFKILVFILWLNCEFVSAQEFIPINEIENKLIQNKKYIVIELYTDWCGICAIQDKKIQKNVELIDLLENEFYYIKFNAESTESFILNGIKFENSGEEIHEFAKEISSGSEAFPAWIIMNPELQILFQYNGLIDPEDLRSILLKLNKLY